MGVNIENCLHIDHLRCCCCCEKDKENPNNNQIIIINPGPIKNDDRESIKSVDESKNNKNNNENQMLKEIINKKLDEFIDSIPVRQNQCMYQYEDDNGKANIKITQNLNLKGEPISNTVEKTLYMKTGNNNGQQKRIAGECSNSQKSSISSSSDS